MSRWTNIIDSDVAWASQQLGMDATSDQILELLARQRGRAYAAQEIQAACQRIKLRDQGLPQRSQ